MALWVPHVPVFFFPHRPLPHVAECPARSPLVPTQQSSSMEVERPHPPSGGARPRRSGLARGGGALPRQSGLARSAEGSPRWSGLARGGGARPRRSGLARGGGARPGGTASPVAEGSPRWNGLARGRGARPLGVPRAGACGRQSPRGSRPCSRPAELARLAPVLAAGGARAACSWRGGGRRLADSAAKVVEPRAARRRGSPTAASLTQSVHRCR
ncbi:hypothetical protein BDA96_10G315400 [Sorghum bicolor]|uniref:Uncharacterized protein n=1 Tax=Sorghum bicolor TaxID=4558 RepID=A0A921Q596_SORBI|nr:hypothetical protein BDA96_10G315400 [Sorghum bicolor]